MAKVKTINRQWLVGEWLLDGSSLDSSWSWNDGTATNLTFDSTDRWMQSQCGVFNGSSSFVTIGSNMWLTSTWDSSMSLWFNAASLPSSWTYNYITLIKEATTSTDFEVLLSNSWWTPILYYWKWKSWVAFAPSYNHSFSAWVWYHLVITRSNSVSTLFVNWIQVAQWTVTWNWSWWTNEFNIWYAWWGNYFNWKLQTIRYDMHIYSSQEIQTLYQEGLRQLSWQWYGSLFDGLVAQYDFQWDAQDVIGGNNGTVTGATLTTDRFGIADNAYNFVKNSSQYIDCGSSSVFQLASWYTIACWCTVDTSWIATYEDAVLVAKDWNVSERAYYLAYHKGATAWTTWFNFYINWWTWTWVPSTIDTAFWWPNSPTSTDWYYVVWVHTWNSLKLYVNWVEVASTSWTTPSTNTGTTPLQIWARYYTTSRQFHNWQIDDVQIFNKAKTPEEIKLLYQLSSTTPNLLPWKSNLPKSLQNGLVMWLNEQGKDLSGNGNNATLVNWPTISRRIGEKGLNYVSTSSQYLTVNISTPNYYTFAQWYTITNDSITIWRDDWTNRSLIFNPNASISRYYAVWWNSSWTLYDLYPTPAVIQSWKVMFAVFVWDNWSMKIYHNWVLIWSVATTWPAKNVTQLLNIWRRDFPWNYNYHNWNIFDTKLYDRALSDLEIQQLYNATFIK